LIFAPRAAIEADLLTAGAFACFQLQSRINKSVAAPITIAGMSHVAWSPFAPDSQFEKFIPLLDYALRQTGSQRRRVQSGESQALRRLIQGMQ